MTTLKRKLLAATLLAGLGTSGIVAKHFAESAVLTSLRAANLVAAEAEVGLFSGDVTIVGLEATRGTDHLRIGRTILHSAPFSLVTPAFAAAGKSVEFEDISGEFGTFSVEIPQLKIVGSNLTEKELTALFDAESSTPLSERLAKLNAESIESNEVTLSQDRGDDNTAETVYSNIKATGIVAGKVASFNVESIEQTADMKDGSTLTLKSGAMVGTGYNLPLSARFLFEKGSASEPLQVASEPTKWSDITYTIAKESGEGTEVKIGAVQFGTIKMRAMTTSLFDWAQNFKPHGPDEKPDAKELAAVMPVAADMFRALEFSAEMTQISFKAIEGNQSPEGKIGRIAITDFGKGGIGALAVEGVSIDGPGKIGHGELASAGYKGLMLSPTFDTLAAAATAEFKDFNPRNAFPSVAQVGFAGLSVDVPAQDGAANSADGKNLKFSVGKFEANLGDYLSGIPTTVTAGFDHVVFDAPPADASPNSKMLRDLGISKFDGSAKLSLAYSEASKEIALNELSANDPAFGKLAFKGLIGGVSKDVFDADQAKAMAAAIGATVKALDVKLENSGAVDKVIALKAKESGQSPDDFKKGLVTMAAAVIPSLLGGDSPSAKTIADAVSKFLSDPKNLHIELTSKDGLGTVDLGSIGAPAELLKKIDVKAGANE